MKEDGWKECKFDFRKSPTECPYCKNKVIYTSNSEVYGKKYGNGGCYKCTSCDSYVGVHDTKRKIPLGRISNSELRKLKKQCHNKFDYLWKEKGYKRQDCYGYLAIKLNLKMRETHFGWFDKEYLFKTLEILEDLNKKELSKYIHERIERKNKDVKDKR